MPLGASRQSLNLAGGPTPLTSLSFVTSAGNIQTTGTTSSSFTAGIGDLIVYMVTANNTSSTSAAPPTSVTPSGFTQAFTLSTPTQAAAQTTSFFYQISTTSGGRTISSFTGTQGSSHMVLVYRPNSGASITSVDFPAGNQEITVNTPANQTLTYGTMTDLKFGIAYGANTNSSTTSTQVVQTTTLGTRQIVAQLSTSIYARASISEGSGFSGTNTVSKTDLGTNTLISTIVTVS